MARKTLIIIFLLIGFSSNISSVNAHSVLMDSNPNKGETVTKVLTTVVLKFNTKIEKGSRFYIEDGKGNKREPSHIKIKDDTVEGIFKPSVPDGNYTLYWKVIGSDGHQIKGNYEFTVKVSGNENQKNSKQKEALSHNGKNKSDQDQANVEEETEQDSSYWGITVLAIIILGLCVWVFSIARRKVKGR